MNPVQQDKIKQLIKSSPMLSEAERGEWLNLLELMNDKQALELEKILTTPTKPVPSTPAPVKPASPPQSQAARPSLSHIVNLPKDLPVASNFPLRPVATTGQTKNPNPPGFSKPKVSTSAPEPRPAPNNFSQQLASMLKEKELQGTKATEELELPEPVKPRPPALVEKSVSSTPPVAPKPLSPAPFPPRPATPPQPQITRPIKPLVAQTPPRPIAQFPPAGLPKPLAPLSAARPAPLTRKPAVKAAALSDLNSVETLDLNAWQNFEPNAFMNNLKSLAKDFGYHNLEFSLEHSLLYQTYINTGLQLLQGKNPDDRLMSKSEFEAFADLLRWLPTNSGK